MQGWYVLSMHASSRCSSSPVNVPRITELSQAKQKAMNRWNDSKNARTKFEDELRDVRESFNLVLDNDDEGQPLVEEEDRLKQELQDQRQELADRLDREDAGQPTGDIQIPMQRMASTRTQIANFKQQRQTEQARNLDNTDAGTSSIIDMARTTPSVLKTGLDLIQQVEMMSPRSRAAAIQGSSAPPRPFAPTPQIERRVKIIDSSSSSDGASDSYKSDNSDDSGDSLVSPRKMLTKINFDDPDAL